MGKNASAMGLATLGLAAGTVAFPATALAAPEMPARGGLARLLEPFDHFDVELLAARHRNPLGFFTRLSPDLAKKGTEI